MADLLQHLAHYDGPTVVPPHSLEAPLLDLDMGWTILVRLWFVKPNRPVLSDELLVVPKALP
jgi:hypothetical protein